ncbi:MAG: TolC family protein [Synergistes sp.]|nr:TolC family protein [Synergistes sp.]
MKINRGVFLVFSFLAALCTAAYADSAPLDIKEALRLTLENNAELKRLRQDLVKADAFRIKADGTRLPAISVAAVADIQREPQTSDGSDRSDSRGIAAALEQELYTGGRNSAIRAQAPQVKTLADMAVADAENSAAGELYALFYNVSLRKKQIEAEEAAVTTSEMHLKQVRKMLELGLANRLEEIRAGQQLAGNMANLATAHGLFESSLISLMNYMGIEPKNSRPVSGDLYEPAEPEDKAASLELAQRFRADKKRLEEQIRYQENQIKIERSAMLPKLTAGLSSGWTNPYRQRDDSGDSWRAEISLAIPVFDRNVSRSAVIAAKAVQEQNRIALEQKDLDIKSEIETAWTDIITSRKSMRAQEKALELAKETLRLAEIGYREGVTPQLDLLDAQSGLTRAQLEYNRALYNCLIASVALKVTEGTIVSWDGEEH